MGLTPKPPSKTDKVLGIIGAVAGGAGGLTSLAGGGAAGGDTGGTGGGVWTIDTGSGPQPMTHVGRHGGIVGGSRLGSARVSRSAFAGARRMQMGGIVGDTVPILAHRGELVTPLEAGTLPVDIKNGVPEVRTPGGERVPVDIRGERDVSPVVFAAGAIVIMAQPGQRLDETVGQAAEAAFTAGARQRHRNTGRTG